MLSFTQVQAVAKKSPIDASMPFDFSTLLVVSYTTSPVFDNSFCTPDNVPPLL